MSTPYSRPRRRLRSELLPLGIVLLLPLALIIAFPSGAVGFVPRADRAGSVCANAMVVLGAAREAELLAAARSAWQSDPAVSHGTRADLLACDFSQVNVRLATDLDPVAPERQAKVLEYAIDPIPSGVAAVAPAKLVFEQPAPAGPTFSKQELLQLKEK